jgi:hypothetical protein
MAAWFAALLPFIPDVIKLATPLFTRTRPQDAIPDVLEKQIIELQDVATKNAEAIKTLAGEMQKTIDVLQRGAISLADELKFARTLSIVAAATAMLALCLAAYAVANVR